LANTTEIPCGVRNDFFVILSLAKDLERFLGRLGMTEGGLDNWGEPGGESSFLLGCAYLVSFIRAIFSESQGKRGFFVVWRFF